MSYVAAITSDPAGPLYRHFNQDYPYFSSSRSARTSRSSSNSEP
jgi:hypothetical protein